QLREQRRVVGRNGAHVESPHPGGEEGLMRIPHRGVGYQDAALCQHPLGKALRTELIELLPGSRRRLHFEGDRRQPGHAELRGPRPALGFLVAVDDRLTDVLEYSGRAIALAWPLEQLRCGIDELGCVVALRKLGVCDQLVEKAQIRDYTANA